MMDLFTLSRDGQALLLLVLALALPSTLFIKPLRMRISRALGLDSSGAGIACLCVACFFCFALTYLQFYRQGTSYDTDFPSFYYAARVHRAGGDLYDGESLHKLGWEEIQNGKAGIMLESVEDESPPQILVYPYIYPPLFATALLPLSRLSLSEASMLFRVLNVAALACVVIWLLEMFGTAQKVRPFYALFLFFVLITSFPVDLTLHHGQVNVLVLFLMMASLRLGEQRARMAGLCLALVVLLKVTPMLLVLWLLLKRHNKTVAWAAAFFAALAAIGVLVTGIEPWMRYFTHVVPNLRFGGSEKLFHYIPEYLHPENVSVNQSLAAFMNAVIPGHTGAIMSWILGVVILGSCFLVSLKPSIASQKNPWPAFSLLLAGILLASPIAWRHHYVLLLPAYMTFFHYMVMEKRFNVLALFCIIATNAHYPQDFLAKSWGGAAMNYLRLFGLVVLFAILCRSIFRWAGKADEQEVSA